MASINKVTLIGNLGADPEIRYMPDGSPVATFSVATSDSWKDSNGVRQERTEWHRAVLYRNLAELAGKYLHKGASIYLEGRMRSRRGGHQVVALGVDACLKGIDLIERERARRGYREVSVSKAVQ